MKTVGGSTSCARLAREAAHSIQRVQDLEADKQASNSPADTAGVAKNRSKLSNAIEARDRALDRLEKFARDKNSVYEREQNVLFMADGKREYNVEELTHRLRVQKEGKWDIDEDDFCRSFACFTLPCCCMMGLCLPVLLKTESQRAFCWRPERRLKEAIRSAEKVRRRIERLGQEKDLAACALAEVKKGLT